jgi:cell wall-associated NlpC family hydrolase
MIKMNEILKEISELEPYSKGFIKNNENKLRQSIINIAKKYLGARYHVLGMLPYSACDCMTLLIMTFAEARLIKLIDPPFYRPDFSFHTWKDSYLDGIQQYGHEVKEYKPGDIILYKFHRVVDHAAIVLDYPTIIHALCSRGVILDDASQQIHKDRERAIFSFWE